MSREEIDISNFKKDLDIYWEKVFRKEKIEYSSRVNEEIQERINSGESFDSIPNQDITHLVILVQTLIINVNL